MAITKASSNAVAPAAKGDLVVGNATNDSGVLAVGSTDQVLTVDSSTATGLKWATASALPSQTGNSGKYLTTDGSAASWGTVSAGGLTLLSTTNLSGANTQITGINQTYKNLVIWLRNAYANGASKIFIGASSTTAIAVGISGTSVVARGNIETPMNVGTSSSVTGQNSYCRIQNYADSTYGKAFQWYGNATGVTSGAFLVTGVWNSASTVTVLEISVQGAGVTWSGGQVLIYGEN